jgi:hypothetical protein
MDSGGFGNLFEVQDVNCVASAGEWALTFRGGDTATRGMSTREGKYTTKWLRFDATHAEVKAAMEALTAVGRVSVGFSRMRNATDVDNDRACTINNVEDTNHVTIKFLDELGNLPTMIMTTRATEGGNIFSYIVHGDGNGMSVQGSKQNDECSGRGICDRTTGLCTCFAGYTSSDGNMKPGDRGDCGAVLEYDIRLASG